MPHAVAPYCIRENASLLEAVSLLAALPEKIVLVVNEEGNLVGTVVDGDVRRALLKGVSMTALITEAMFTQPIVACSMDEFFMLRRNCPKAIRYIPILNESGRVVSLGSVHEGGTLGAYENIVVVMAGGLGSRLGELTRDCPKPMLRVHGKPILEHVITRLSDQGFTTFFLSVNYRSELIEDYFLNGARWGISIRYLRERKRMGTAGALSLLPKGLEQPLIVMNGDVLTTVDVPQMLSFHVASGAHMTSAVSLYQQQVPFGVVRVEGNRMRSMQEKPVITRFINAGIYVLNPECLNSVPEDTFFDMPELLQASIDCGDYPAVFPLHEEWLDVGRPEDFARAAERSAG